LAGLLNHFFPPILFDTEFLRILLPFSSPYTDLYFEVFGDRDFYITTQIVPVKINIFDVSVLSEISTIEIVADLVISTLYRYTTMRRFACLKQFVYPIGISPFSFRVALYHFTDVSIAEQWFFSIDHAGLIVPIGIFGAIQKFWKHGIFTQLRRMVEPDGGFLGLSFLGRDQDHSRRSLQSIYSCCRGIFEYRDGLYFFRVQLCHRTPYTIYDNHRCIGIDIIHLRRKTTVAPDTHGRLIAARLSSSLPGYQSRQFS